jgi:hypothetical protein
MENWEKYRKNKHSVNNSQNRLDTDLDPHKVNAELKHCLLWL